MKRRSFVKMALAALGIGSLFKFVSRGEPEPSELIQFGQTMRTIQLRVNRRRGKYQWQYEDDDSPASPEYDDLDSAAAHFGPESISHVQYVLNRAVEGALRA